MSEPNPTPTQLERAKALLRLLYAPVENVDLRKLHDLLNANRRTTMRPDPSITRETWALLDKAHDLLADLRDVLRRLQLD